MRTDFVTGCREPSSWTMRCRAYHVLGVCLEWSGNVSINIVSNLALLMQRARISYSHFRTDYVGACSTGTWSATMRLVQEDSEINNSPGMGALAKELKNLCELTTGG